MEMGKDDTPLPIRIQMENAYQIEAWNKCLRFMNIDVSKTVYSMQGS